MPEMVEREPEFIGALIHTKKISDPQMTRNLDIALPK
jgi:hypothetical protein